MPPTPQLGHLAQELVSPMVKEELQEDFSALKDGPEWKWDAGEKCEHTYTHTNQFS